MLASVLLLTLTAAPFPLPAVDGKPLAVTAGQASFRLPMRFDKVRAFYEQQFKGAEGVKLVLTGTPGARSLSVATTRITDSWKSATVKEGELETVVELKAVMRLGGDLIVGKGPPVEFIFTRSPEVQGALKSIDHTESMRAP